MNESVTSESTTAVTSESAGSIVALSARVRALEDELQRQVAERARGEALLRDEIESLELQLVSWARRGVLLAADTTAPDTVDAATTAAAEFAENGGHGAASVAPAATFLRRKEADLEAAAVRLSCREEALAKREAHAENKEQRLEQWQSRLQREADALQDRVRDLEATLGAREDRVTEAEAILKDKISRFEAARATFLADQARAVAERERVQRKQQHIEQVAAAMLCEAGASVVVTAAASSSAAAAATSGSAGSSQTSGTSPTAGGAASTPAAPAADGTPDAELRALDAELAHLASEIKLLHKRQVAANAKRAFLARKVRK